jgi:hypothetical protein
MAELIKAFVSSTFEDLKHHRARVVEQLRNLGVFVDPMENWSAAADEPREFCCRRLDGCDLCILLVAFRRGFIPDNETLSITQLEYQAALERGIVVLPFLLKDDVQAWPPRFCENDPGIRRWREQLQKKHGVGWFTEDPQLLDVGPAVLRWLMERSVKAARQQPPPAAQAAPAPPAAGDDGLHDLGDFAIELRGVFDQPSYPADEEPVAHLLVEAKIRRNNLASSLDVPAEICLVLDVSGSMRKENRYGLLEQAVAEFCKQLGAKDRAAVVIFSTTAEVISGFEPASTLRRNVPALLQRMRDSPALYGLKTNVVPALGKAVELLRTSPTGREAVRRIYVLTDGGFHDAKQALGLLPRVAEAGAEIGIYGLGTEVQVRQLQRLLRGQQGGWVKPIVDADAIRDSFAHIAEVSKALAGQEGRLFIDFDKRITLGDAWAFRPHEIYFGQIPKRRGNCDVGPPEANRTYSMLFEIRLPKSAGPSDPVAQIGFVWRNGKQILEHHRAVRVEREHVVKKGREDAIELVDQESDTFRVSQAFLILDALRRELTKREQLAVECARLEIAAYEGRSPDLIRTLEKKVARLRLELGQEASGSRQAPDTRFEFPEEIELTPKERLLDKASWQTPTAPHRDELPRELPSEESVEIDLDELLSLDPSDNPDDVG